MMHQSNQNGRELLSTSLVNHDNGEMSAPSVFETRLEQHDCCLSQRLRLDGAWLKMRLV